MHGTVGNNLIGIRVQRDGQDVAGYLGYGYEGLLMNENGGKSRSRVHVAQCGH